MFFDRNIEPEAFESFKSGFQSQMEGDYKEAVNHYKKSLEIQATAEAHTFLGWAYSFLGKVDEAIKECEIAIQLDPNFGNPYNDIGSYLMKKGKYKEAIPWLENAKTASRYENREYPYYNLGKVYEYMGLWPLALDEYKQALEIEDNYLPAQLAILKLQANSN